MSKFDEFVGYFSDQINEQFSLGESKSSLTEIKDGKNDYYAGLGDFSKKIDQSEQRDYVEEGFLNNNFFNTSPKRKDVVWQNPNATILIKKRMFSSLKENYKEEYLDKDEYLFVKASKQLFKNKANQISSYEKLTKIKKVIDQQNYVDPSLLPEIVNNFSNIYKSSSLGLNSNDISDKINSSGLLSSIEAIKKIISFYPQSKYTSWIEKQNAFSNEATGVIEITNFTNLSTSSSNTINSVDSCSISIDDPYEFSVISENDIDKAISDVTSLKKSTFINFGLQNYQDLIDAKTSALSLSRNFRKASNITFNKSSKAIYGYKLICILDSTGEEILFDTKTNQSLNILTTDTNTIFVSNEFILNSDTNKLGANALNEEELNLFKEIILLTYKQISLEVSTDKVSKNYNEITNAIRYKMHLHYLGKTIIQPMDEVHVYIQSQTTRDTKLLTGIRATINGQNYLDQINGLFSEIKNQSLAILGMSTPDFDIEKSTFGYPDMPTALWLLYRNYYISDSAGSHVYAGLVTSANSSYSSGKFQVSVNTNDFKEYLNQGKINFNPGVDQFNGAFFDPLTPFKTSYDDIGTNTKTPEFTDENKKLLTNSYNTSLVKAKFGNNYGKNVTTTNFISDKIQTSNGSLADVFYAPDGLSYKWKQGISVLTQYGNSDNYNNSFYVGTPSISKDPFAGQDVMNIISLCITGIPYNYYTYYKASKQLGVADYYKTLTESLQKSNQMWGDFRPFKLIDLNNNGVTNLYNKQQQLTNDNKKIFELLDVFQTLSYIKFESNAFSSTPQNNPGQIDKLKLQLQSLTESSISSLENSGLKVFGNDVELSSEDAAYFGSSTDAVKSEATNKKISKKLNYLTKRISRKVRENTDQNLFIVDDSYDHSIDIQGFEKSLSESINTYNSDYTSVKQKIELVSQLLNLEVYCDTQGNIRARFPQYNKMPTSVFNTLLNLKKQRNISLFPKFLENLFKDQVTRQLEQVRDLEDQVRVYAGLLFAKEDDKTIASKLSSRSPSNFKFISDESGNIDYLEKIFTQSTPIDDIEKSLEITFDQIKTQSDIRRILGTADLAKNVMSIIEENARKKTDVNSLFSEYINQAIKRLKFNTSQDIETEIRNQITSSKFNGGYNVRFDNIYLFQKLQQTISNRQKLVSSLNKAIAKLIQGRRVNGTASTATSIKDFAKDFLNDNKELATYYSYLLEDEDYDDLGPNSGKRYVIDNAKIISYNISENKPNTTMVQVDGILGDYADSNLPNSAFNGGGLVRAAAIDYDMWSMYGFQSDSSPIKVPFFDNVENQCAPYAAYILSLQRKNILRGTITIIGNEYMQPGEVVYISQRNLLFYVKNVTHNFIFGSNFTTTLTLEYGHTPGEYIPTSVDVIGKALYNNKNENNFITYRDSSHNSSDVSVGTISIPPLNVTNYNSVLNYKDNQKTLTNIFSLVQASAANSSRNAINQSIDDKSLDLSAGTVNKNVTYLKTPVLEFRVYGSRDFSNYINVINEYFLKMGLSEKTVNITQINIDLNDVKSNKSPSQIFWSKCRDYAFENISIEELDSIEKRKAAIPFFMDCWITFKDGETNA